MLSRTTISFLLLAVTGIGALRASLLTLLYVLQTWDVQRRHAEAAGFMLAATLLTCALASREIHGARAALDAHGRRRAWIVVGTLGLVIFGPSLFIGLLSDDFVLLDRAAQWQVLPVDWEYVRPVPLALWGIVSYAFGPTHAAPWLHALNIALHLVNASLVYAVGTALGMRTRGALLAAALYTVFPTNVEPVVWASGVFDLALATFFLLLALIVLRTPVASRIGAIAVAALTLAALGTKETAVATPFVLTAIVFATDRWNRASGYWAAAVAGLCVAPYVALRVFWHPGEAAWPTSGYQIKELISRPLASLGLPLHIDTIAAWPIASAFAAALIPLLLFAAAYGWVRQGDNTRLPAALLVWIYAAVAPLMTMMFVGPDLQGSRYLYVSSAAWSLVLAIIDGQRLVPIARRLVLVTLLGLIVFYALASSRSLQAWREAALVRDTFLTEVEHAAERCESRSFSVPDNHHGAFVLRNGAIEALRHRGIHATPDGQSVRLPPCAARAVSIPAP